jgi:hypothetical protein
MTRSKKGNNRLNLHRCIHIISTVGPNFMQLRAVNFVSFNSKSHCNATVKVYEKAPSKPQIS